MFTRTPRLSVLLVITLGLPACVADSDEDSGSSAIFASGGSESPPGFVADGDGWSASAPAMGLSARFDAAGAVFHDEQGGELVLETVGWGRNPVGDQTADKRTTSFGKRPSLNASNVPVGALSREGAGGTEWWQAFDSGFAQGWTLAARPEGQGPIEIHLRSSGAVVVEDADGSGAEIVARDESRWQYFGVQAWDADGQVLPAFVETAGDRLTLVVDDSAANWPITVDPVVTTAASTFTSASFQSLGRAVAGGDVNGDGYDDFIVSAFSDSGSGAVYVYYSSATGLSTVPDATLYPATSNGSGEFGSEVETADFDQDGYEDIAISEPKYNNGTIYIFYGSASGIQTSARTVFAGTRTNEWLGWGLAVGDWNGDGYHDLIGTARYRAISGVAYAGGDVHYGGPSGLSTTVSVSLTPTGGGVFGYATDGAGDINGDGFDDVVFGHPESGSYYGKIWIYYGAAGGMQESSLTMITGPVYDTRFAAEVAGVGDVNGDGFDDVAVGATGVDVTASDAGAMYVYYGSAAGIATSPSATLYGSAYYDLFGWAIAGAGDTNGDLFDDVIVASPYGRGAAYATGLARVIPGSAAGLVAADADSIYAGTTSYEMYGEEVSDVGDVNDDGLADVAVGHPDYASRYGRAYVYLGTDGIIDDDGDGYFTSGGSMDCDDTDPSIHPAAVEVCDGIDQDCDTTIDDGATTIFYADADGDGYGDPTDTRAECVLPAGYVSNAQDCNDGSALAHPGGAEVVGSSIDEDCDGGEICYLDADRDGTGVATTTISADADCADSGEATTTTDCDDSAPTVYPLATEIVGDAVDQDCDGVDTCYADSDGDLHGSTATVASPDLDCADPGESTLADDCDDAAATTYLGAAEVTADGVDQDCNGGDRCYVDADSDAYGSATTQGSLDLDCLDAVEAAVAGDCNDLAPTIHPGGVEIRLNGIDEDCDGGDTCYADDDSDGFGSTASVASVDLDCEDQGESVVSTDCDDAMGSTFPSAPEVVADGVDQDCDDVDVCYFDADGDRFGAAATVVSGDLDCGDAGEAVIATDCDDSTMEVWPGAEEAPADGIDQNCDYVDDCYADSDGDDHGSAVVISGLSLTCLAEGESTVADDCNDGGATVFPGAAELTANGVDEDCNGLEVCYFDGDGDGEGVGTAVESESLGCDVGGVSSVSTDCDDTDASRYSAAAEIPLNESDENCDGEELCYADEDGDTYGDESVFRGSTELSCVDEGVANVGGDCDDAEAAVYPTATELAANGVDEDCDLYEDCYEDRDLDGHGTAALVPSSSLDCVGTAISELADDCNDEERSSFPGGVEVPANAVDEDCDGGDLCYLDADGDSFGAPETTVASADMSCVEVGESVNAEDCNDGEAGVYPEAVEACNEVDDDCDGEVDEGVENCPPSEREKSLCGCDAAGGVGGLVPLVVGLVVAGRRRRFVVAL